MRHQHRWIVAISFALTGSACEPRASIPLSVSEGAQLPAPQFIIGDSTVPDAIYFESTYGPQRIARTEWALRPDPNVRATAPIRLTYAVPPAGFVEGAPARPLFPGALQLRVVRNGLSSILALCVQTDGTVSSSTGRCAFP